MLRSLVLIAAMVPMLCLATARPFVGVLLLAWISFMSPQDLIYGFTAELPWAQIAFAAAVIGCFVAREPKRLRLDSTSWLLILFMIFISLSSLAALAPADKVEVKWETVMKTCVIVLVARALLTDRIRIHALLWAMVISIGFYGVRGGLFTVITGGNYRIFGPPSSMIGDNNHLAVALLVALPLMNFLRLHSGYRPVRMGLAAAMMLTLLSVLGSYSRGAFLGLGAVALLLWWNSSHKLLVGPILAVCIAAGLALMPAAWSNRMATIETYQDDSSATGRLAMWEAAWRIGLARPLTGGGFMGPYTQSVIDEFAPETRVSARAVHSIYFEVIGEHGFPAFLAWASISVVGILNTIRIRSLARRRPELEWCGDLARMGQVSIAAYLVGGAFLSLSYWDFYFVLLAILAATRRLATEAVALRERLPSPTMGRAIALPNAQVGRAPCLPAEGTP